MDYKLIATVIEVIAFSAILNKVYKIKTFDSILLAFTSMVFVIALMVFVPALSFVGIMVMIIFHEIVSDGLFITRSICVFCILFFVGISVQTLFALLYSALFAYASIELLYISIISVVIEFCVLLIIEKEINYDGIFLVWREKSN